MELFTNRKPAVLVLEDASIFEGDFIGDYQDAKIGEIVFQTSMTGYQEVITDPSYKGQIVIFTFPIIGNYGVNNKDIEFEKPSLDGIIIKEYCDMFYSHQAKDTLENYLSKNQIACISNLDTRHLVRHIREKGSMRGGIFLAPKSSKQSQDYKKQIEGYVSKVKESPNMIGQNLSKFFDGSSSSKFASEYKKQYNSKKKIYKVGLLDFGVKYSIIRELIHNGIQPIIFNGSINYRKWKNFRPNELDGFVFSNGPGDPSAVKEAVENIQYVMSLNKSILAICLGHQILSIALKLKTFKMKFGHHGGNQPSLLSKKEKVLITSQNHGFSAIYDIHSNSKIGDYKIIEKEINPNDNTIEAFWLQKGKQKIISVQYHPEAGPGPNDAKYIFEKFYKIIST